MGKYQILTTISLLQTVWYLWLHYPFLYWWKHPWPLGLKPVIILAGLCQKLKFRPKLCSLPVLGQILSFLPGTARLIKRFNPQWSGIVFCFRKSHLQFDKYHACCVTHMNAKFKKNFYTIPGIIMYSSSLPWLLEKKALVFHLYYQSRKLKTLWNTSYFCPYPLIGRWEDSITDLTEFKYNKLLITSWLGPWIDCIGTWVS